MVALTDRDVRCRRGKRKQKGLAKTSAGGPLQMYQLTTPFKSSPKSVRVSRVGDWGDLSEEDLDTKGKFEAENEVSEGKLCRH